MAYGRGGRYTGPRGSFGAPKPVEVGKEYNVEISEISRQGDGIARIQGFVIFVKGAKAGQKARVRISRVGDRFANGEIVTAPAPTQQPPAQEEKPKEIAPSVPEDEKPSVQDYKATEQGEKKLE